MRPAVRWLARALFLLAIAASLAALFYLGEQRDDIARQTHILSLLDRLESRLNELYADVVSARLGELIQYDGIAGDLRAIERLSRQLDRAVNALHDDRQALAVARDALVASLTETRRQAFDTVRFIASRRSSMRYLPTLLEGLRRDPHVDDRLRMLAHEYHAQLLSLATSGVPDGRDDGNLATLRQGLEEERRFAESESAALLDALLRHGQLVGDYSIRIHDAMKQLLAREPLTEVVRLRRLARDALSRRRGLSNSAVRVLTVLLPLIAIAIVFTWLRERGIARRLRDSNQSLAEQMRERQSMGALLEIQRDTLEKVASAEDPVATLDGLCEAFERLFPGSTCVLCHAPEQRLRLLSAPSLDESARLAFEGQPLDTGNGSCGATILGEEALFINDVAKDPRWARAREPARRFGIRACWSHPVYISAEDTGSFTLLRERRGIPDGFQRYALETGARLAGIALRRAQDNRRIQYMATRDSLTSLPNRALFRDRLELALERARRHASIGGVLFVDLDHFKDVNDSKGHSAGDRLLVEVARRLRGCLRSADTVARLGGDEFVVLIEELGTERGVAEEYLHRVAEKIRRALGAPFEIEGSPVSLSASIGIILFPLDADSAEHVLQHADAAMYVAKNQGRNRYHFFRPEMIDELDRRLALETSIARAVERDEFELWFQPKVDEQRRLLGAEALLRWRHPQRGILPPNEFLPVLYRLGLIRDVEFAVLRKACGALRQWREADRWPQRARLSINISSGQFRSSSFARRAGEVIADERVPAACLELELTEQLFIEDAETAARIMKELKALGMRLAIDDYGTGYSSLMYLKKMPLDTLKIDQGFIRDLPGDEDDAVIVDTIIGMAGYLGLRLVAEGVEHVEQLDYLRLRDVCEFQGFLFSRPLPAEDFEREWLGEQGECLEALD